MRQPQILALMLLIGGCASAPTRYFELTPGADSAVVPNPHNRAYVVVLRALPELVDRPQLVVEEPDGEVRILQHERWAAPLHDQVEQVLVRDLRAALGTENVDHDPRLVTGTDPLIITIEIERFAVHTSEVVVAARWQWHAADGAVMVKTGTFSQPLASHAPVAFAQGWSHALADMGVRIAGSLTE